MTPDKVAPSPEPQRPAERSGSRWPMREVSAWRVMRVLGWPAVRDALDGRSSTT